SGIFRNTSSTTASKPATVGHHRSRVQLFRNAAQGSDFVPSTLSQTALAPHRRRPCSPLAPPLSDKRAPVADRLPDRAPPALAAGGPHLKIVGPRRQAGIRCLPRWQR